MEHLGSHFIELPRRDPGRNRLFHRCQSVGHDSPNVADPLEVIVVSDSHEASIPPVPVVRVRRGRAQGALEPVPENSFRPPAINMTPV